VDGLLPEISIPNGVLLLLSKKPVWFKNPIGFLLLESLTLACPPPPMPPLLRRETTFLNLAHASPVSAAMLLSRAGSCCWESKASTPWQLSTAALFAASTSSMAQMKSMEKKIQSFPVVKLLVLRKQLSFSQSSPGAAAPVHRTQRREGRNRSIHRQSSSMECSHRSDFS
jgi:hypothetical protein